jgi:hypothetical protein
VGETSEFAGEAFDAARGGAPKAFPGRGGKVTRNILSRSGWNGDGKTPEGNFRDPPRFLDESGLDFRLSPDSPAIDSGESSFSIESAVDLAGSCRRASRVCTSQASTYPVDLGAYELPGFCDADPVPFVRGDCNANRGVVDLSDSVELFTHLFISQRPIACSDACDANDDGRLDISDGIYILSFLFTGGPAPAPPGGEGRLRPHLGLPRGLREVALEDLEAVGHPVPKVELLDEILQREERTPVDLRLA